MVDNIIMKITQKIKCKSDKEVLRVTINEALEELKFIYSYIVYRQTDDYLIQYNLSQQTRYNTLPSEQVCDEICNIICNDTGEGVEIIGYNQPSLEIILEAFDPLVHKLARVQGEHWQQYEHDDLCQMCRLIMVQLYRKGYYLHKRLIEKALVNQILMETRNDRNKPLILSFDDVFYKPVSNSSEQITIADIVPDTDAILQEEEEEHLEGEFAIFAEVKDIIIDLIGIRQWNELFRDYSGKHTSTYTRKLMLKVKNHFEKEGLTRSKFNEKYHKR